MPRVGEMINPRPRIGSCRLILRIGGASYVLRRLDRPALAVLEGWRLIKPDGTAYDVARTEHGCTCDCPDYAWRRDGVEPEGCKHIRSLIGVGLLGGVSCNGSGSSGGDICLKVAGDGPISGVARPGTGAASDGTTRARRSPT